MDPQKTLDFAVRHRYLVLSLLGALLYTTFIGLRDVWYPDEPDIAEVSLAMFLSGDWIAPRRMGVVWVDYPPMIYWIGVVSSHLFGEMTAFALRLPNALTAIAIVLITCAAASRWYGARVGFWSGFALATCLLFVYEANSYRPDIWFTLGIASGIFLYAEGALGNRRLSLRAAGFACFGVAMLAKGILGLLLPGLVLVLWHATKREWRRILQLAPLSLIAISVFLPWVAGTAQAMGWEDILYEFYAQNFGRFGSGSRGHEQAIYYYLKNFWLDFSPWSWLFPAALLWFGRTRSTADRRSQLLLWWFGTFFVFLSLAETKRQLYMLPAFPAFAVLMGIWLGSLSPSASSGDAPSALTLRQRPVHIYSIVLASVLALLGVFVMGFAAVIYRVIPHLELDPSAFAVANSLQWPLLLFGSVMAFAAVWIGLSWRRKDATAALQRIGLGFAAVYLAVFGIVMPNFAASKTYKPQGEWIRQQIGVEQTHIGMVYPGGGGIRKRGAFAFETGGVMVELLESDREVEAFFEQYPDSLVLVEGHSRDTIFGSDEARWQTRTIKELRVGRTVYYVVTRSPSNQES